MRSIGDTRANQSREIRVRVHPLLVIAALLIATVACGRVAIAGDLDKVKSFDIPAQSLDKALLEFGMQAHVQINFAWSPATSQLRTAAVKGRYAGRTVLSQLLNGTGLQYSLHGNTVEVTPPKSNSIVSTPGAKPRETGGALPGDPPLGPSKPAKRSKPPKVGPASVQLQEITVTGTHIRSAEEPVLPTQTFTREDIDRSGLGTVAAFLQAVPANFTGGMSEATDASIAGGGQGGQDTTGGTGVNLRGLGNDATLVLLDGHRIAPADLFGNFVDLSLIPLNAVRRIDVVTDGASAVYGSDAVGGVVNIVTRKHIDGVETRVSFGSDDRNTIRQSELGQSFGRVWGSGSGAISYEFYDKTPLSAADRDFTRSVPLPFTLLPGQVRHSVLATVEQSLGSNLSLYSDAYFSHRSTNSYDSILGLFQQHYWSVTDDYGSILGARISLTNTSELDISGDFSVGDANVQEFDYPRTTPISNQKARSTLATEEAVLNGSLWHLPAGQILYAVGAQFRQESYHFRGTVRGPEFGPRRHISSGFAELRIPLLSSSRLPQEESALELSLADREDIYSDAGSTNNSSFGVLWVPAESLRFRSTYGTSFVAPLLNYTNATPSEVAAFSTAQLNGSAPPNSGPLNVLIAYGGSAHLVPQTATTWTLGAGWKSPETGLAANLDYYNARFSNRISSLQSAGYNPFFALPKADILGPTIVRLDPSAGLVQELESSPDFVNFGASSIADIAAVIDSRELNLSQIRTDGVDLHLADRVNLDRVSVEPGVDATYILHFNMRFTASTPMVDIVDTIYNPTKVRLRGRVSILRDPLSVSAFVNFVNSYTNNTTTPYSSIGSWTTLDLSVRYSCEPCRAFPGFNATFSVINALNRAPPYAKNTNGFAVNYDGANSNPLGRFVSLDIGIRW